MRIADLNDAAAGPLDTAALRDATRLLSKKFPEVGEAAAAGVAGFFEPILNDSA
jgi:hypothetical protein